MNENIIERNGIWWPQYDRKCHPVVPKEVTDIDHIMQYVKKTDCVIQAGGNVGLWPIKFSKFFKEVYTFEPEKLNYTCLKLNTKDIPNIFCFPDALGEEDSLGSLDIVEDNCGGHNLSLSKDREAEFNIVTIDSLELPDCDLAQFDIEGYELQALKGAEETIKRHLPVIVVEYKPWILKKYGTNPEDIEIYLNTFGYKQRSLIGADRIYTA